MWECVRGCVCGVGVCKRAGAYVRTCMRLHTCTTCARVPPHVCECGRYQALGTGHAGHPPFPSKPYTPANTGAENLAASAQGAVAARGQNAART